MRLSRRDAIVFGSGLAAGSLGLWGLSRRPSAHAEEPRLSRLAERASYGHGVAPPTEVGPLALDRVTRPPAPTRPLEGRTRALDLEVVDQRVAVAEGRSLAAWTFGGTLPGPILRAALDDPLEITLRNRSGEAHNLHFHGRHDVAADGWEPVPPGGESVYRLSASPIGVHPYHCDMTPDGDHIANGLYGALIVDPPGGRPPAEEFVLVLGGFDTDGDGKSDVFGFNGMCGFYAKFPLKVPVGSLVRVYVVNMAVDQPMASFHLHAQTFDVYRTGTRLTPDDHTDVVMLGPTERAILEFRLPNRGRYMFHPHQRHLAEGGAMGWFAAV